MIAMAALARLDGVAQAELCARGELSADELRGACLARIEMLNPLLRAVVSVADSDLPVACPPVKGLRPLAGVPFLMKDSAPWPGLRWAMGSRLLATNIARQQTPYGRRLQEAGLICVGKTSMSELGLLASTETQASGVTHNPWDLSLSAGGSSGGSAVAVAAGLVPFAHACDGGGSIRIPASVCGVFGFKPSRGRTVPASLSTSDFLAMTSDHCISRSVRDSALFLALTENRDATWTGDYVRAPIRRRLRIASLTRTMSGGVPDAAVHAASQDTTRLLQDLGHVVEPISWPELDIPALAEAIFVVAGAAVAGVVDTVDRTRDVPVQQDELEPFTWALLDMFHTRGPQCLARARETFAGAVRAYREATRAHDVVLTPTVATVPWRIGHLSPFLAPDELMRRTGLINGYAPLQNLQGAPAMSVPLHFPDDGAPMGSHFSAAPGDDEVLLGLAYELEEARPWTNRWPPFSIPAMARSS